MDDKPRAMNGKHFVPRTWFFGGFLTLFLGVIVQIAISGVILKHQEHFEVEVEATTGGISKDDRRAEESLFFFNSDRQVWADNMRPPGFENMTWSQVVEAARGTTVTFAVQKAYAGRNYVGNEDQGIPSFFAEELKRKFDITLEMLDLPAGESTKQSVEKTAPIDFIWMNKEKFIYLRDQKNTWGPYAKSLPNGALFDFTSEVISTDFGIPTDGEEMPFHVAHFVMAYNSAKKPNVTVGSWPPKTVKELIEQVIKNEIKFHPATPASFLGTPFLEQVFYHYTGYENIHKYREAFDETWWLEQKNKVFPVLKEFHKNLVITKNAEGRDVKYSAPPKVREMFSAGEVDLTAEYAPGAVFQNVEKGLYPKETVSFMFDEKMVSNTNFLTIPKNAPNKAGAMVAINLASSLEHQYKRFIPNKFGWKALQAYNPFKAIVKMTGYNTVFDEIEQLEGAPTVEEMTLNRVGEFNLEYWTRMKADWAAEIGDGIEVAQA